MKNVIDYLKGVKDGREQILNDIMQIVKSNEYPEYLEEDIVEYLKNKGYDV